FVATLSGEPSHDIVTKALVALRNLDHRGASGAEPNSGDGAGILLQVPDDFFRGACDFDLPDPRAYAVGMAFLPREADACAAAIAHVERIAEEEGLRVVGWRDVPHTPEVLGATALSVLPELKQLFVTAADSRLVGMALERRAFALRKRAEREAGVYCPSLSSRTLVYKGMLTTAQLEVFYPDLSDPRVATA